MFIGNSIDSSNIGDKCPEQESEALVTRALPFWKNVNKQLILKFLDAGIQDVSTSISIVHDLIEISPDEDGDQSDKHI